MHLFFKHSAYVRTSGEFKSDFLLFKRTKCAYLLSFTELLVLEAPGDGGCGVTRSLAGQGDLVLKLRGRLVIQVGDLGLHYEKDPEALVTRDPHLCDFSHCKLSTHSLYSLGGKA